MLAALALLTAGGVLVYSAFQTPPDPREVLAKFFGARGGGSQRATRPQRGPGPRAGRRN